MIRNTDDEKRLTSIGVIFIIFTLFSSILAQEVAYGEKKSAVLIGVDKYPEDSQIPLLRYAESDVNKLSQLLSQNGYDCQTLLNENATKDRLTEAFIQFEQQTSQENGELDIFLCYFSGRSARIPDDINADEMQDSFDECLLFYDAEADNLRSYLRDDILSRWLSAVKAKQVILILDTSFGGDETNPNVKGVGKIPEAASLDGIEIADGLPSGVIILAAAAPNSSAIDGVFTSKFLEACVAEIADQSGDRIISFGEAYGYAHQQPQVRNAPEPAGSKAADNVILAPLPPLSKIRLDSNPSGSEIRIEGRGPVATRQLETAQQTPAIIPLKHGIYKVWAQKSGFLIPEAKEVEIKAYDTLYSVETFQLEPIKVEGQTNLINIGGEPLSVEAGKIVLQVKQANREIHRETLPADGRFRLSPASHKWLAVGSEYELQATGQPVLSVKPTRFTYQGYDDIHTALTITLDDIPPKLAVLSLQASRLVMGEEIRGVIKASDDGLGLSDTVEIQLQAAETKKAISVSASDIQFRTPTDYEFRQLLPDTPDDAGEWRVFSLTLQDKAGNKSKFSSDQIQATFLAFANRYLLGRYYFESENYKEALLHLKQVSPPSDEAHYLTALSYYHQGDLNQAISAFQSVESKTDYLGKGRKKSQPLMPRKMVNKIWGGLLDDLKSHKTDAKYIALLAATAEELGRSYEAKVYEEYAKGRGVAP